MLERYKRFLQREIEDIKEELREIEERIDELKKEVESRSVPEWETTQTFLAQGRWGRGMGRGRGM